MALYIQKAERKRLTTKHPLPSNVIFQNLRDQEFPRQARDKGLHHQPYKKMLNEFFKQKRP